MIETTFAAPAAAFAPAAPASPVQPDMRFSQR